MAHAKAFGQWKGPILEKYSAQPWMWNGWSRKKSVWQLWNWLRLKQLKGRKKHFHYCQQNFCLHSTFFYDSREFWAIKTLSDDVEKSHNFEQKLAQIRDISLWITSFYCTTLEKIMTKLLDTKRDFHTIVMINYEA